MRRSHKRLLTFVGALTLLLIAIAVFYMVGMSYLENKPRGFWDALEWAGETLSTTGYGADASWRHPLMVIYVVLVQFIGVFLVFLVFPVYLIPFLEERFEPAPPEATRPARAVASATTTSAPGRARNTFAAELGMEVAFAGSSGPIVELRTEAAVLEDANGARVVIPYGERVERDGRRAQLTRGASADITHASPELVTALKTWRKQRASSDGVPAYIVLSDAHLEGIADRRPESLADLARCTGIGPTKLERYGDEIIAVIADSP